MSVLWIISEDAKEVTCGGMTLVDFPRLNSPAIATVLEPDVPYLSELFERIVKFWMMDGKLVYQVIKGDRRFKDETRAIRALNRQGRFNYLYDDLRSSVKGRFKTALSTPESLDKDILPLLQNPKWLCDNTLTPFWSCSGHVEGDECKDGYLALSGDVKVLESILKRLKDVSKNIYVEPEIMFLTDETSEGNVLIHPTLCIRWGVEIRQDIRFAINEVLELLEQGLFNY